MSILPIEVKTTGINQVDQLNRKLGGLERQGKKAQDSTSKLSSNLTKLAGAAVAYIAIDRLATSVINLGKSFTSTADTMSLLNSRLSLVTASSQELAMVQNQLLTISNNSRVGIESTSNLYAQLARSTQSLGLESSYLLDVTRTISQTLTISGASAQSADAALFQLSQGFSAGALRGEELNSVLEQTPRLAQAIADGMGVSIGQLRQLGAEGALSTEKVLGALKTQAETVNAEFKGIAVNASSGFKVIENSASSVVERIDKVFDVTKTVGQAFVAIGETFAIVSNSIIDGYENNANATELFAQITISAIGGVVGALGSIYDIANGIGGVIDIVQAGFYALMSPIQLLANTVNTFLNSLLSAADAIGRFAGYGGIDYRLPTTTFITDKVTENVQDAIENFKQVGTGGEIAKEFNLKVGEKFADLRLDAEFAKIDKIFDDLDRQYADKDNETPVVDTTAPSETNAILEALGEYGASLSLSELQEIKDYSGDRGVSDLVDYLISDKDITDTATTVTDLTESNDELKTTIADLLAQTETTVEAFDDLVQVTDDLNNTYTVTTTKASDLNDTLEETVTSIEILTASFTDTFIRSLENNINSLNNLANDTTFNTVSYSKALQQAQEARDNLIANPLDVEIGEQYKTAYDTFTRSASSFIQDTSRFSSREAQMFAQSTFRTQSGQLQATATEAATVLDGIRELTELINTSFADGILTDEEKTTIASVADSVNIKNESLLGTNGQLAGVINGQVYFDNSDVVDTIGSQTYYDNALLAKDSTLKNGISVTDSQIQGLSSLSQEQKDALIKANEDRKITNEELTSIVTLSTSQLAELLSVSSSLTNGISVTDSQIIGLTSVNTQQRDALLQANSDSLLTISELQNISGLSSDNIAQLVNVGSVLSSDINGQTYFDNSLLAKDATLGILDNTISQSGLSTIQAINEQEYYNNKETIDAINGQTYFDNGSIVSAVSGIVLDNSDVIGAINSQKYYDNANLMKDSTFTDNGLTSNQLSNAGLYKGQNITIDNTGFTQTNFTDNVADTSQLMKDSTFTDNGITNAQFGLHDVASSKDISSQKYYDNTELMKDSTFSLVDVSSLAKDSTFTSSTGIKVDNKVADTSELMKNSTFVSPYETVTVGNQLTDYAKSEDLTSTSKSNSIATFLSQLMGADGKGISLKSFGTGLGSLSVATGLDVSALGSIATNTGNTATNANNTKNAVTTMAGGVSLKNLQIKRVSEWVQTYGDGTSSKEINYTYYAKGGFTGKGMGAVDSTGYKQAGIVHEDEWVAPKWMLNQNPSLFNSLEAVRQKGSFATGGYTGARTVSNSSSQSDQILMSILNKIDSMDNILRRVTENGESMNVVLQG